MEPIPPSPSSRPSGNWWTRNWKWFVPTGCCTMLVLLVAFVCSIALIIFGAMKSSDVYQGALAKAKTSSAVTQVLGSPIKDGLFLSGSTNVNGASGEANLAIPLSGPKGEGTLYVVATKSAGLWTYSSLILEVKQTKKRIDLLHGNK